MKDTILFSFENSDIRVTNPEDGQLLFAATDVCSVLGYKNVTDTLKKKVDNDDKELVYLTDRSGQKRQTWTINEFGLYDLILSSSKPEAKVFKRWVTHEVLPSIRKAGRYTSDQERNRDEQLKFLSAKIVEWNDKILDHQEQIKELKKHIKMAQYGINDLINRNIDQLELDFGESDIKHTLSDTTVN